MTLEDAIQLAHWDRDGYPLSPLKEPKPTIAEAIEVLEWSVRHRGHVWLTGIEALRVLREAA